MKEETLSNPEAFETPSGEALLGAVGATGRGFELIEFRDRYGAECSLQQSSLAEYELPGSSAVWLGCDKNTEMHLGQFSSPRMHLDREQVAALISRLQNWLETGSFEAPNDES